MDQYVIDITGMGWFNFRLDDYNINFDINLKPTKDKSNEDNKIYYDIYIENMGIIGNIFYNITNKKFINENIKEKIDINMVNELSEFMNNNIDNLKYLTVKYIDNYTYIYDEHKIVYIDNFGGGYIVRFFIDGKNVMDIVKNPRCDERCLVNYETILDKDGVEITDIIKEFLYFYDIIDPNILKYNTEGCPYGYEYLYKQLDINEYIEEANRIKNLLI